MTSVSVIIPFFNTDKCFYERCIESVCRPDIKSIDLQVIVVDDGSDEEHSVLAGQVPKRYGLDAKVIHKCNGGQNSAREEGLRHAEADCVLFLDSDDMVDLESLARALERMQSTECDIMFFNYDVISPDGVVVSEMPSRTFSSCGALSKDKALLRSESLCTQIYRRHLLLQDDVSFSNGLSIAEDLSTAMALVLRAKKIGYVDDVVYHYVKHRGSVLSSPNIESIFDVLRAFDFVIKSPISLSDDELHALEYMAIIHVLYWGGIRSLQCCGYNKYIKRHFFGWMSSRFPRWQNNPFITSGVKQFGVFFHLMVKGFWRVGSIGVWVHSRLI